MKIGFDNQKYLKLQSERILERVAHFGGKLYLEFGGKLFDDYHASRVLPGFQPDSKMKVLLQLKEQVVRLALAGEAKKKGITTVVFDRSGYVYHGRVAALAEGAREGGLDF